MKVAEDFRRIARTSLAGRWGIAVLAGFLAAILGAVSGNNGGGIDFNFNLEGNFWEEIPEEVLAVMVVFFLVAAVVSLVISLVFFVVGSNVIVGYKKFNLNLVDRAAEPEIKTLFSYFRNWKTNLVASFLRTLYIFLWSLLFVIPGIVAGYSYAMTDYILAENPELTASQAIEKSKTMMYGNRWRLFCLRFSFIGWDLLCSLTFGIGYLWLTPYKQAAEAAFYRDISGTEYIADTIETVSV